MLACSGYRPHKWYCDRRCQSSWTLHFFWSDRYDDDMCECLYSLLLYDEEKKTVVLQEIRSNDPDRFLLLCSSWLISPDICCKISTFGNLDLGLEVLNIDRIAQLKQSSVFLLLVCSLLSSRLTQVSSCYSLEPCGTQILSPN